MSKESDKEDLRAIKAVEVLMKYCNSKDGCNGCVFHELENISVDNCMIGAKLPINWDVEDTIKFYKED